MPMIRSQQPKRAAKKDAPPAAKKTRPPRIKKALAPPLQVSSSGSSSAGPCSDPPPPKLSLTRDKTQTSDGEFHISGVLKGPRKEGKCLVSREGHETDSNTREPRSNLHPSTTRMEKKLQAPARTCRRRVSAYRQGLPPVPVGPFRPTLRRTPSRCCAPCQHDCFRYLPLVFANEFRQTTTPGMAFQLLISSLLLTFQLLVFSLLRPVEAACISPGQTLGTYCFDLPVFPRVSPPPPLPSCTTV